MEEVRKKIAARIDAGDAVKDIAERFMVSKSIVYKVKSLYNVFKDFSNRPRSGRPRKARTEGNIKAVNDAIDANPRNIIQKLARELNIDKTAISTIVRKDLGLKSRACTKVQGLTALQRQKRLDRCKKLLKKCKRRTDRVLIFSDEKIFTVDAISNSRATRYIAKRPEDVDPGIEYVDD
ncbi:uncharacterized protein LOC131890706 [Tigriopus californicus]|uniref:uncharacterized protein LOC131890706 n=1 Tax=Tigriopus californicus TaxID=6832 RepID=UPI0027DA4392|nr:uncharacterized protein LOC131890706 [Tigriopus californicus]